MRVAILTSTEPRHQFFVARIAAQWDVAAIVQENTGYSPARTVEFDLSPEEAAIVKAYYEDRSREESVMCARISMSLDGSRRVPTLGVDKSTLNSSETIQFINEARPEVVLVYGTNLIKPPLLDAFAGRMVNMHLGLSPYYRGTATNFYPLLNDEPEYIGATIHLIDAGIDSGAILAHARPAISADDRPHTIGCNAIDAGIEALLRAVPEWVRGNRQLVPQWQAETPRLYLRKHFHPRQVVELNALVRDGLIRRYVERASIVAPRVQLVN